MALFSEDMNWYRGKVERVLLNEKKAEVFYVDYGNSERCSFDHLKPLPESLAKRKALAFECKLDDMIPKSQSKWKKSVSQIFKEILEGL